MNEAVHFGKYVQPAFLSWILWKGMGYAFDTSVAALRPITPNNEIIYFQYQVKRRQLILSSLGYLAAFALVGPAGAHPSETSSHQSISSGLEFEPCRLFPNLADAKTIGHRYLAHYPEKSDRNVLLAELGLPAFDAKAPAHVMLKKWVRESQQRDFSAGNTVIVDRWLLSRTEASLCALAALS